MRIAIAAAVACLSIVGVTATAQVHAAIRKHTEIPAEPLDLALRTLARERGFQVVYLSEDVQALQTRGAVGDFTVDEALKKLLSDSRLEYKFVDENTVSIFPKTIPTSALDERNGASAGVRNEESSGDSPSNSSEKQFRVAQVDQGQTSGPVSVTQQDAQDSKKKPDLDEIVVTGTHIRGTEAAGSSVTTITREDIDKSGYARIEDVLSTLTQNFNGNNDVLGTTSPQSAAAANFNRGSEIQLRGLGPGTTLTLLNGQRLPGAGIVGNFFDISMIPASAVERIEVLADGASAIYGSDAIGGVVNVNLRKDFQGAETRLLYGSSDGSANDIQFGQLFGMTWSGGNFMVGYQFNRRNDLPADARPLSSLGENYTSLGGNDFRLTFANPGTILNSSRVPYYAIPTGQNGTHLSVADLIPGSANYSNDVTDVWAVPRQQMNSAFFSASQWLGNTWELFADGLFSSREMETLNGGANHQMLVPNTNPFYVNPNGGTGVVRVDYNLLDDLGPLTQKGTTDQYTGTVGATAHLTHEWQVTVSASYGYERDSYSVLNSTTTALLTPFLADSDPATALNVFGAGSNTNPATLAAIRYNNQESGVSTVTSGSTVADGPLFDLPGGSVRLAVGTDYRNETLDAQDPPSVPETTQSRHVFAGFAELAIPIIGPAAAGNGPARLELSAAGRYEHYSDFGQTTNPKIGLKWLPAAWLDVRGTWGTAFRAPPFADTNLALGPVGSNSEVVVDPKSPTGQSTVLVLAGNNPDLKQETATVWTAGFDLLPTALHGFKTSLTYFNINYRDQIGMINDVDTALQFENYYAPIITRNPTQAQINAICNSPTFIGACGVPIAAIIDDRFRNLGVSKQSGLDFDVSQTFGTTVGSFKAGVNGTYTFKYEQSVTADAPVLSVLNTVGEPLKLRLRGNLSWNLRNWYAGAVVNYSNAYDNPGTTPDTVASFTTLDLHAGYTVPVGHGLLSKTQIYLSALNVLDRMPPFVNQAIGYDAANANLLGRTWSVQLIKGW